MMIRILIIIAFFLIEDVNAQPLSLKAFAKQSEFVDLKLSPDGKYFAAAVPQGDKTGLVIIRRATMEPTYVYQFARNEHVDRYEWANNERLVFTRYIKRDEDERPFNRGQIYAGNFDGSKKAVIFGYLGGKTQSGTRLNKNRGAERSFGEILHMLPDDPKHIIIAARQMTNDYDSSVRILKLNIYTYKKSLIARTPLGNMRVILNSQGEPVFSRGRDVRGEMRQFLYKNNSWEEIKEDNPLHQYRIVSTDKSGSKLYLLSYFDSKTESLFEYDLSNQKISKIYQHPTVDIGRLIRKPEDGSVVGVEIMPGKIEFHYIDDSDEFAKLHSGLARAFVGQYITITSRTRDQKEMIVLAQSDKNPGDFYLFDNEKKSASHLLSKKSWIYPEDMSEKKPIQFESRDGVTIYGYLTLPKNKQEKAPLVTYVHGGPYGVQDVWWYESETQMLANNGYAVLQVNYRGSGGFGREYERVAYRKRSTLIQQDIIDGTRWAMSLPEIEANNACIMGWSFGGYSALMAPLLEPELFKCSIAAAGVYDAIEQEDDADYSKIRSVAAHAMEIYGDEEALLKKESPLTYIDRLSIPVFIVHGGKDKRVPPEQAYILKAALDERNLPYEWMFKESEGHGFYREENREEFYDRSLKFLEKYLR